MTTSRQLKKQREEEKKVQEGLFAELVARVETLENKVKDLQTEVTNLKNPAEDEEVKEEKLKPLRPSKATK